MCIPVPHIRFRASSDVYIAHLCRKLPGRAEKFAQPSEDFSSRTAEKKLQNGVWSFLEEPDGLDIFFKTCVVLLWHFWDKAHLLRLTLSRKFDLCRRRRINFEKIRHGRKNPSRLLAATAETPRRLQSRKEYAGIVTKNRWKDRGRWALRGISSLLWEKSLTECLLFLEELYWENGLAWEHFCSKLTFQQLHSLCMSLSKLLNSWLIQHFFVERSLQSPAWTVRKAEKTELAENDTGDSMQRQTAPRWRGVYCS